MKEKENWRERVDRTGTKRAPENLKLNVLRDQVQEAKSEHLGDLKERF